MDTFQEQEFQEQIILLHMEYPEVRQFLHAAHSNCHSQGRSGWHIEPPKGYKNDRLHYQKKYQFNIVNIKA